MEILKGNDRFYIENDNQEMIAYISYQYENDEVIVANSTFVDPSLRGGGVAKKLLDRLTIFARQEGLKIRPLCSYVVKAFERYNDYDDVKLD